MIRLELNENWKMREIGEDYVHDSQVNHGHNLDPAAEYISAVVPGTVYTDLLREGRMEDPFWKDNEDAALRLMDQDYEYVTRFDCPEELLACERILLHFDGVDTIADIWLNGSLLGSPCNMHRTWEYEVGGVGDSRPSLVKPQDNELRVVFHSPTKYIAEKYAERPTRGSEDAMDGFVHIRKAHCMFGWDWGAHLPDAGLFRPVSLLGIGAARIDSVYVTQEHIYGSCAIDSSCKSTQEQPASRVKKQYGMEGAVSEKIDACPAGDVEKVRLHFDISMDLSADSGEKCAARFAGAADFAFAVVRSAGAAKPGSVAVCSASAAEPGSVVVCSASAVEPGSVAAGSTGVEESASALEYEYRVTVTEPDGRTWSVTSASPEVELEIDEPKLWWPNGYGEQNLYTVSVELYEIRKTKESVSLSGEAAGQEDDGQPGPDMATEAPVMILLDTWTRRIGLRTLTMHREKDQWGESFACRVNGVDIFAMGADYIPEDHLLGRVTPQTTRTLLEKAKWANFNSIRVWGGGYYPDDWFYDACDELGLVVWQDFMFACAVYDLTPEFEANIRAEFADNIKRLRHHASLGLWCGNNEMESFVDDRNSWVSKPQEVRDYLFMYERVIPEKLAKYDPQTFYWPSSPSSGGSFDNPRDPNRGDVHYWEVWHGDKPFTEYRKFFFRYLSEFGFQSFPAMKTIEQISDDPADYNIFSYVMEKHQRNGSANGKIMNYMQQTYRYPSDFQTVLYASQLLQADGIRYGVEHFRRNRGRCMGAVYWQLNDCWPVASWSSIDYCGRLKALHYYAKRFFAPLMISCEEQGLMTSGKDLVREHFEFEKSIRLNVANETMQDETVTVRWALRGSSAKIQKSGETVVLVPALTSVWLDKIEFPDADIYRDYISYELEKDGEIISDGTVIFSYPKYFRYEDPQLSCRVLGDEIEVTASAYAKSVEIRNENEDLLLSDNYFDMNAGTKRVKIQSGDASKLRLRSVYDIR